WPRRRERSVLPKALRRARFRPLPAPIARTLRGAPAADEAAAATLFRRAARANRASARGDGRRNQWHLGGARSLLDGRERQRSRVLLLLAFLGLARLPPRAPVRRVF